MKRVFMGVLLFFIILVLVFGVGDSKKETIRVGYFPNITHGQALVGMSDGSFQKELGKGIDIKTFIFNAGPSVIEAMMSGQLDLAYVGPNPAINGFIKTKGALLRIIAGAASGGAGLVVRQELGVIKIEQLNGLKIASPQLGNTQDVSLRYFLKANGLKLREQGGAVEVIPIPNPDQLLMFMKKQIDGAWTVEPWVSRLIVEAGGNLLLDERSIWRDQKFVTANIIVSQKFLHQRSNIVKKWLKAHVVLTRRLNDNPDLAEKLVNAEIKKITGKPLPDEVIKQAFSRFELTYDPLQSSLIESANHAFELGFLGKKQLDLSKIYDLKLLNQVLEELKLAKVKE